MDVLFEKRRTYKILRIGLGQIRQAYKNPTESAFVLTFQIKPIYRLPKCSGAFF